MFARQPMRQKSRIFRCLRNEKIQLVAQKMKVQGRRGKDLIVKTQNSL